MDMTLAGGGVQGLLDLDKPLASSDFVGLGQGSLEGLHCGADHAFVGFVGQAAGQVLADTFFGGSGIGQGAHLSLSYCFTTEKEISKLPCPLSREGLETMLGIPYIDEKC